MSDKAVVKVLLPNDRYLVTDRHASQSQTAKIAKYEKIVAVDRMNRCVKPEGVSENTASESGKDDVDLSSDDQSDSP